MTSRPALAVIGPGAAGCGVGAALASCGWPFLGFVGRSSEQAERAAAACGGQSLGTLSAPEPALASAGVVVIAVRDPQVAGVAASLAASERAANDDGWAGRVVLHLSSAYPLQDLFRRIVGGLLPAGPAARPAPS